MHGFILTPNIWNLITLMYKDHGHLNLVFQRRNKVVLFLAFSVNDDQNFFVWSKGMGVFLMVTYRSWVNMKAW